VVHLYEIIETNESIHLIMEYVEGGELFDLIVKQRRLK
jgi:serine/threonine protein kinase